MTHGHRERLAWVLGIVLVAGCTEMRNPQCIEAEVELGADDDLGGVTMRALAAERSTRTVLVDGEGETSHLDITTEVVGPVDGWVDAECGDAEGYASAVIVTLRSDDGRIDLALPGRLILERADLADSAHALQAVRLELERSRFVELDGTLALSRFVGTTSTWAAVEFDLSGRDGMGTIDWITTTGVHVHAARFHVPWHDTWL
ncbi:MAG: hypothetical protein K1X88_03585 [Nannocystaceae bacterium]|nr:hypothetical protein [Nannocystaceae bacterium]